MVCVDCVRPASPSQAQGNELYRIGDYAGAIEHYSQVRGEAGGGTASRGPSKCAVYDL